MLRRLLAAALLVPLLASPASADDLFEIDGRLIDAGYEEAYTESLPGEDGARVVVDFASGSTSEAQYEQEAAGIAELVWMHLEEQVQTVDVAPTTGVPWLGDDLPPAVSFTRDDLTGLHGERSAELDQPSGLAGGDVGLGGFGVLLGVLVLVGGLVLGGLVLAVVLLARRPPAVAVPWGYAQAGYGAPGGYPTPASSPPGFGTLPAGPPGYGTPPPPPTGPWQPPAG